MDALQLKGGMGYISKLAISSPNIDRVMGDLDQIISRTPQMVKEAPVVLTLDKLDIRQDDFAAIVKKMREVGVKPYGVRGPVYLEPIAPLCDLAYLGDNKADAPPAADAPNTPSGKLAPSIKSDKGALLLTQNIRSGQQVYAEGRDLIIHGNVSPGAELLADGHIHVYGALRGRALSGLDKERAGSIFCTNFKAELISISGHYLPKEHVDPKWDGAAVSITLGEDGLAIETLNHQ